MSPEVEILIHDIKNPILYTINIIGRRTPFQTIGHQSTYILEREYSKSLIIIFLPIPNKKDVLNFYTKARLHKFLKLMYHA